MADFRRAAVQSNSVSSSSVIDYEGVSRQRLLNLDLNVPPPAGSGSVLKTHKQKDFIF